MSNSISGCIYLLVDPRDNHVRYVGQTAGDPKRRLYTHLRAGKNNAHTMSARWIRGLLAEDLKPEMRIVERDITERLLLNALEREWIANGKFIGWKLTNHTAGGEGLSGMQHSAETRAKMSAKMKAAHADGFAARRVLTSESRERMATHRGKRHSPDVQARITAKSTATRMARGISEETRRRIGAKSAERWGVLTLEQVLEMRTRHAAGEDFRELARAYGCTEKYAWRVVMRETWKYV